MTAQVVVRPGVNFTSAGRVIVDLKLWAKLQVHEVLSHRTVDGKQINIEAPNHSHNEKLREALRRWSAQTTRRTS